MKALMTAMLNKVALPESLPGSGEIANTGAFTAILSGQIEKWRAESTEGAASDPIQNVPPSFPDPVLASPLLLAAMGTPQLPPITDKADHSQALTPCGSASNSSAMQSTSGRIADGLTPQTATPFSEPPRPSAPVRPAPADTMASAPPEPLKTRPSGVVPSGRTPDVRPAPAATAPTSTADPARSGSAATRHEPSVAPAPVATESLTDRETSRPAGQSAQASTTGAVQRSPLTAAAGAPRPIPVSTTEQPAGLNSTPQAEWLRASSESAPGVDARSASATGPLRLPDAAPRSEAAPTRPASSTPVSADAPPRPSAPVRPALADTMASAPPEPLKTRPSGAAAPDRAPDARPTPAATPPASAANPVRSGSAATRWEPSVAPDQIVTESPRARETGRPAGQPAPTSTTGAVQRSPLTAAASAPRPIPASTTEQPAGLNSTPQAEWLRVSSESAPGMDARSASATGPLRLPDAAPRSEAAPTRPASSTPVSADAPPRPSAPVRPALADTMASAPPEPLKTRPSGVVHPDRAPDARPTPVATAPASAADPARPGPAATRWEPSVAPAPVATESPTDRESRPAGQSAPTSTTGAVQRSPLTAVAGAPRPIPASTTEQVADLRPIPQTAVRAVGAESPQLAAKIKSPSSVMATETPPAPDATRRHELLTPLEFQPLAGATSPASSQTSSQFHLSTPVHQPAWAQELNQTVTKMATQDFQRAELHLNPAQLGPLDVVIEVKGDQASAQFSSPHAIVRDAVEQALPKLREMMAQNGIALGNATVSDQGSRHSREGFSRKPASGSPSSDRISANMSGAVGQPAQSRTLAQRHTGLLDTFA